MVLWSCAVQYFSILHQFMQPKVQYLETNRQLETSTAYTAACMDLLDVQKSMPLNDCDLLG